MPITLPENYKPSMPVYAAGDFVELPFPYLRMSWNNGNPHASQLDGAKYFGGFQRGTEDIAADLARMNLDNLPNYFTPDTEWISDNGAPYMARSSRFVYAAPILCKDDWYKDKETGKRAHRLDFLVYLASVTKEAVIPWGPSVISSHGFAGSGIVHAFQGWARDSKAARAKWAGNMDPMFFYHAVGTFGQKRNTDKARDSVYVPCDYNRVEWTETLLTMAFVGESIAAVLLDLQVQAKEWFEDQKGTKQKGSSEPQEVQIGFKSATDAGALPF